MDRWTIRRFPSSIDHILTAYHMPLHEELPRLEAMADKVVRVHGDKDPERLPELLALFRGLKAELDRSS